MRAIHAGEGHVDVAARMRPPRVLAQRDNRVVLLDLGRVLTEEGRKLDGVLESVTLGHETLRGSLASFVVEERRELQHHSPNIGSRELEALGGDILVDVVDVLFADRQLNQLRQTEGLIEGGWEAGDELVWLLEERLQIGAGDDALLLKVVEVLHLFGSRLAHDCLLGPLAVQSTFRQHCLPRC